MLLVAFNCYYTISTLIIILISYDYDSKTVAKRNISVEMEDVLISDIEREMVLSGLPIASIFRSGMDLRE